MYFLSLLAIFKNETMNLRVWLDHYIWQGVEHFYLIDNGSTDNPLTILQEYIDKGIVSYFYRSKPFHQLEHYRTIFDNENLKKTTRWLIIADLDEFFYGLKTSISAMLPKFIKYDVIYCNWLMFGSSGLIDHPLDIRTSLINRDSGFHPNKKYIFKPASLASSSQIFIHHIQETNHNTNNYNYNKHLIKLNGNPFIHLNHYPIQSKQYFENVKMRRGDVNSEISNNIRNWSYFKEYDQNKNTLDHYLKDIVLLNA